MKRKKEEEKDKSRDKVKHQEKKKNDKRENLKPTAGQENKKSDEETGEDNIREIIRLNKRDYLLLGLVVLISIGLRVYGLSFPNLIYFDETHYVPAGWSYLDAKKIDPNDMHPPLAKELMAIFIPFYYDNALRVQEIRSWQAILMSLKQRSGHAVEHLWNMLDDESRKVVNNWQPGDDLNYQSKEILIAGFNKIIKNKTFYNDYAFQDIKLNEEQETYKKEKNELTELQIKRFNRLLLESVYPVEIEKSRNAVSWRIGGVVFGVLGVIYMYFFGLVLFKNRFGATISAFLTGTEFLHIVQSRIATLDIYLSFFIIGGYYYAYLHSVLGKRDFVFKNIRDYKYLILSAIFLGCSISIKLNALAGIAGLVLYFIFLAWKSREKEGRFDFLGIIRIIGVYSVMSVGVFLLCHVPLLIKGMPWDKMIYIKTFRFHYTDKFTHPYLSQMWQWPTVHRPIWYFWDKNENTQVVRGIVAMGNLLFWWSFIPILLDMIYRTIKEKNKNIIFILCGYLPLYLLWITSINFFGSFHFKGGFFYYMLPCVPFMVLGVTETLDSLRDSKIGLFSVVFYLLGTIIFLVFFYPILTGMPISQKYFDILMRLNIFKSWL